jgi:hypothetical protein
MFRLSNIFKIIINNIALLSRLRFNIVISVDIALRTEFYIE